MGEGRLFGNLLKNSHPLPQRKEAGEGRGGGKTALAKI